MKVVKGGPPLLTDTVALALRSFFRCFVGRSPRMYLKFVESVYLECLKERMTSDIKFEAVAR